MDKPNRLQIYCLRCEKPVTVVYEPHDGRPEFAKISNVYECPCCTARNYVILPGVLVHSWPGHGPDPYI